MWAFRTELLKMAYAYARLVALSTGLKHAKDGQLNENTFLVRVGACDYSDVVLVDDVLLVLRSCLGYCECFRSYIVPHAGEE